MIQFLSFANPLKWWPSSLEPDQQTNKLKTDHVLHELIEPYKNLAKIVERYEEINAVTDPLSVVPLIEPIFQKLVWPLRHAKNSYTLGNYLGCIALCGMVGEMVAILLWDISKVPLRQAMTTEAQQRAILGNTVERLGQERRVNLLHALGVVDDNAKAVFNSLRQIRNRYLHLMSYPHTNIAQDARRAYENTLQVIEIVLGQTVGNGGVVLRPDLEAYLFDNGLIPRPESDTADTNQKAPPD